MSSPATEPVVTRNRLVDYRLDLLDRILIGLVARAERVEIVRGVESRIEAMLADLNEPEPSDEQVLQLLSRLDPPEALIPKIAAAQVIPASGPGGLLSDLWGAPSPSRRPVLKVVRIACGLAALAFLLLLAAPYFYIVASVGGEEYLAYAILGTFVLLLLATSIAAAVTAIYALSQLRRRNGTHTGYGWATAALVISTIPMLLGSFGAIYIAKAIISEL